MIENIRKIFCNQYQNRLHIVSTSRAYKLSTLLTLDLSFFDALDTSDT